MNWNFRFVRICNEDNEEYIELREVFYDESGKPMGHGAAFVMCDDQNGLPELMNRILLASKRPILDDEYDFTVTH